MSCSNEWSCDSAISSLPLLYLCVGRNGNRWRPSLFEGELSSNLIRSDCWIIIRAALFKREGEWTVWRQEIWNVSLSSPNVASRWRKQLKLIQRQLMARFRRWTWDQLDESAEMNTYLDWMRPSRRTWLTNRWSIDGRPTKSAPFSVT